MSKNEEPTTSDENTIDAERLLSQSVLLTRDEVALVLRTDPGSVDYLHRMKLLRAVKVGKTNRWKPNDVRAYVESLVAE